MRKLLAVLTAAVLLAAVSYPAWPEERQLNAAEIDQILAGNTIEGAWACYDLLSDGSGGVIWRVPSDGYRAPARILEGRQLY